MSISPEAAATLDRARDTLRTAGDRASAARQLDGLRLDGRLGEVVSAAAALLAGGAAPDIDPDTVAAIVAIALDGAAHNLDDPQDEDLDAHLQALRALEPIPGVDAPAPAAADDAAGEDEPRASMFERPSPELVAAFQIEARELLATCEGGLLQLEADRASAEPVHEVFRALHSFKGNCGFLGLWQMEEVAHRAESLLVSIKEGRRRCDAPCTAALLSTVDALGRGVEAANDGLRIPLTLAIIEGMLVRVGDASFTVPLLNIRESVVVRPDQVTVLTNWQELVRIRGELIPVMRMHRLYGLTSDHTALHEGILVVVEDGGRPLCLFVDQLIGQRQTVIKPISGFLGNVRGIAGCTVLGDGRISLILDVPALLHLQAD